MVPPPPPGAAPRAIFIGRLVGYKGLDILLRAMERVPELRLDIVGSGPEGPRLRTLAQALAITDRVRWYGEYPDEDLPRRMADADFLVLPSVTVEEMFGLVVLEAMASGRPVITTALPSAVREVNVPGVTGLEVPLRDVRRAGPGAGDAGARPGRCGSGWERRGGSGWPASSPRRRWRRSTSRCTSGSGRSGSRRSGGQAEPLDSHCHPEERTRRGIFSPGLDDRAEDPSLRSG